MNVVVHPLCLLSTVDHYNRVLGDSKGGAKRVVGVLLGSSTKGTVDVTNSFAVPFEEDAKNPGIFFLDHNYLDTMFKMYKKVNGELGLKRAPHLCSTATPPQQRASPLRARLFFVDGVLGPCSTKPC